MQCYIATWRMFHTSASKPNSIENTKPSPHTGQEAIGFIPMDESAGCVMTCNTFSLETFVNEHRAAFPCFVQVAEGFWAESAEDTLENGQILILHGFQQEQFIVATQSNGVDLCIPRTCPIQVELVPLDRLNDEYSTVEELSMAQPDYCRVLDAMPSFDIQAGSIMKLYPRQEDRNYLACEALGHACQQEVVNLPFNEQARFRPLHDGLEYFLEEVLEQYPLPSKIGIRLVNKFLSGSRPFKPTLPWGVGLRLQKEFQDETIIATVVGEGEGDVLLFPKTLDLTVIPDLDSGVRSEGELIESFQPLGMTSLNRVALLSAMCAYSIKSPIRRFNLECLTPPPLTRPSKMGLSWKSVRPYSHQSTNLSTTPTDPKQEEPHTTDSPPNPTPKKMTKVNANHAVISAHGCHLSLQQACIVKDAANKKQGPLLGCLLPNISNQRFNDMEIPMEPKMAHTEMMNAVTNNSSVTPALPRKQNENDSGKRNPSFYSERQGASERITKWKTKPTDQASFDNERNIASGNTFGLTPPLLGKQNGKRGQTPTIITKPKDSNPKEQISCRSGLTESRKEATLGASKPAMVTQPTPMPRKAHKCTSSTSSCPTALVKRTNLPKSMGDQNDSVGQTSACSTGTVSTLRSEPTQANVAPQKSLEHSSNNRYINVSSQSQVVKATQERFVTMERTLHNHYCTETLQMGLGSQHKEDLRQNQAAGRDFLSHVTQNPVICSRTSDGAQVKMGVAKANESVSHAASSQSTHRFDDLLSLPIGVERQALVPYGLLQASYPYINYSPFSQTLSTNVASKGPTASALKPLSHPYVNWSSPVATQFCSEDSTDRMDQLSTLRYFDFQMDGGSDTRPIPDSSESPGTVRYVHASPEDKQVPSDGNSYRRILPGTNAYTYIEPQLDAMHDNPEVRFQQVKHRTANCTLPFGNGEDENVHNRTHACTSRDGPLQEPTKTTTIIPFTEKLMQRETTKGEHTDEMHFPDQAHGVVASSTLSRSDPNRDFEDLDALNLYLDMRAQLILQQQQFESEINVLKAEITRLETELERVLDLVKNGGDKDSKGCQTSDGALESQDTGANTTRPQVRASKTKPDNLSVGANCQTYENDPRLNGGNATTPNARSVPPPTTKAAEKCHESRQNDGSRRVRASIKDSKKPLPTPRKPN